MEELQEEMRRLCNIRGKGQKLVTSGTKRIASASPKGLQLRRFTALTAEDTSLLAVNVLLLNNASWKTTWKKKVI